jgi:SutA RNAP-binding domain
MKTLYGPSELIEKERVRLQINAQVEEFLRRGGAIEVVTNRVRPAMTEAESDWDDQEELEPFSD